MLIRITGRAEVTLDGGGPVTARSIIRELDGTESDDACANYLDSDLADLGITGGTIKLIYDSDAGGFRVSCAYTAPAKLKPAQLKKLARVTVGQWSDGLGGSCFDALADRHAVEINLAPPNQKTDMQVEQIDDGLKPTKPKTGLAKAARDGDLTALRKHLDAGADLEARLQGSTPLHWAVYEGQVEAALELIGRGADIHARDPQGDVPLFLAALSNAINDADAARVALALLNGGASAYGTWGPAARPLHGEYTPLYMAKNRKKTKLAAVLKKFGATK